MTTWRPLDPGGSGREPRRLSESLDRLTRRLGGPSSNAAGRVFAGWEDLVGGDVAAHCRPASLRDGVLVLLVDDPAWAAQLRFMTADLLAKVSASAGTGEVTEIRLRVTGERAERRGSRATGEAGRAGAAGGRAAEGGERAVGDAGGPRGRGPRPGPERPR